MKIKGYVVKGINLAAGALDDASVWAMAGGERLAMVDERRFATEWTDLAGAEDAVTTIRRWRDVGLGDVRIHAVAEDGTETPLPTYEEALAEIERLRAALKDAQDEVDEARAGDATSEEQTSALWRAMSAAVEGEDLDEHLTALGYHGLDAGPVMDVRDMRVVLAGIVAAWRDDEVGQIDGTLIEEAEALLGITPEADPLACS